MPKMNRALHCLWRILFEPALSGVAQGCVGVRTPGKMHELGVTRSIVDVVLRNACAQQAKQVLSVSLVIGEMRNLEEEWVQRYFDRCAKGTLAEGAKIKIQKVPMAFYCNDCGSTFQLAMGSDRHMCCPDCGSENYDMVTGGELLIKEIEIR